MIKKYRKKAIVVEALLFHRDNYKECEEFIGKENYDNTLKYPNIKTLEGTMEVSEGDYIIKGAVGEFYPCKPDAFAASFELDSITPTPTPTKGAPLRESK